MELDPAAAAAERIVFRSRDALRRRGHAAIALSGGGTAPPMIDHMVAADVDWASVTVFQVDERVAPDGHPARNAGQLDSLARLATVHLLPVTAEDRRQAAQRYGALLPPRLDVVHLGLGDDGHTASWPPGEDAIRDSASTVELVGEFKGWERLTLTRRVVNRARCRVVLVSGAEKRPMVERWVSGDRSIPVSGVRRRDTRVYLDPSAAPAWYDGAPCGR